MVTELSEGMLMPDLSGGENVPDLPDVNGGYLSPGEDVADLSEG